jgi:hypothetical protein
VQFKQHSMLVGQHAFLSASNYHWTNYDRDKLQQVYLNSQAAKRGTELHALAHQCINLGVRLPRGGKTLNQYVNDGIGFRMTTEQPLVYSGNCFGTPDTISFSKNLLRVHDLKTGLIAGNMRQLQIYAALFCLEYGFKPGEISMELRIYQGDEVLVEESPVDDVAHIMSKIITFDQYIEKLKAEAGG